MSLTVERLARWARGEPCAPVRIELHVTNRCNLRCLFCWQAQADHSKAPSEISHEKAIEIVDDAGRIGVKEWIISGGGEPLIRRATITEVFRRIKKHGMWGQLTTNGVLFTPELIEEMVGIGWDQVQFSIDAPDAATHDFLRHGFGAFEHATQHLRLLAQTKARHNSEKPFVGINCVLTNRVHLRLREMIRLASEIGSQLVFFEPVYPGYLSEVQLGIPQSEHAVFLHAIDDAEALANKLGVATNIANFRQTGLVDKGCFERTVLDRVAAFTPSFLSTPCFQPWYLMGIKGNGLAGCCSTFDRGEFIHDRTLEQIWFGETFNRIRQDMIERRLPDYCSKCSVVVVLDNEKYRQELFQLTQAQGEPAMSEDQPEAAAEVAAVSEREHAQLLEQSQRYDDQLHRLEGILQERKRQLSRYNAEHETMTRLRRSIVYRCYRSLKGF